MPYTTHGYWCGPGEPAQPGPNTVARCGGPGLCPRCSREAASAHLSAASGLQEITADLAELNQALGTATGTLAGLRATAEENEQERERLAAEVAQLKTERDEHARKVAALTRVKTWRNEDGREFVFVEDLLDAIGHPTRTENADVS